MQRRFVKERQTLGNMFDVEAAMELALYQLGAGPGIASFAAGPAFPSASQHWIWRILQAMRLPAQLCQAVKALTLKYEFWSEDSCLDVLCRLLAASNRNVRRVGPSGRFSTTRVRALSVAMPPKEVDLGVALPTTWPALGQIGQVWSTPATFDQIRPKLSKPTSARISSPRGPSLQLLDLCSASFGQPRSSMGALRVCVGSNLFPQLPGNSMLSAITGLYWAGNIMSVGSSSTGVGRTKLGFGRKSTPPAPVDVAEPGPQNYSPRHRMVPVTPRVHPKLAKFAQIRPMSCGFGRILLEFCRSWPGF